MSNLVDGKFAAIKGLPSVKTGCEHSIASRQSLLRFLLFAIAFASGLYFALVPNVQRDIFAMMPGTLRRWCGSHDDLCNFLFFAALSFLAFWIPSSKSIANPVPGTRLFAAWRLPVLLGVVAALEIAQNWIPGRFSSLRDVLTGSGGVLVTWLSCRYFAGIQKGAKKKSTE